MFKVVKKEKGKESTTKTLWISYDLLDKLEKVSAKTDVSLNQVIIQCIEYALGDMESEE